MKRISLLALCLLSVSGVCAEATKEIYSDAGFYDGNINLLLFTPGAPVPNLNATGDPNTPEGIRIIQQAVNSGQALGWGLANVTGPGSTTLAPRDFSEYLGGHLRLWMNTTQTVQIKVQYSGVVPDPTVNIPSTGGVWMEKVIALSDLGANATRLQQVRYPIIVSIPAPAGAHTVYMDHVRWTKPLASLYITPATVQVNTGQSRQFTVEGRDAAGELVLVYPTWTSTVGSITAGPTQSGILSIPGASGDGQVTASSDGQTANASVDVTAVPIDEKFGLFSETFSGAELGEENPLRNSELLLFSENNADESSLPDLFTVSGVSPEGLRHDRLVFQRKTSSTQFQGLAVQWGVGASPDTVTRNMANYYSGSLRFWFKGPAAATTELDTKLMVGIRSGNVPAGKETSQVLLSNYVAFDNQWHAVTIPFSAFAKGRPFADLSRTKIFLVLSAAGSLSTTDETQRTFYLDNVRWDTQTPGPLTQIQVTSGYNAAAIPTGAIVLFRATGLDAVGRAVDVYPTWSFPAAALGTFSQAQGPATFLRAAAAPVSGSVRASQAGINGNLAVSVVNASFPGVWNVLTDAGVGGEFQVFTGLEGSDTGMLTEDFPDGAPNDTVQYVRATYAMDNLMPGVNDSFAVWGVGTGSIDLQALANGFLRFFVRTNRNLEIALLSANIDPDLNRAKITLGELGVPLSSPGTGAWQQVLVPLSIFKQREPTLDFAQISNIFMIGSNSALVGEVATDMFDTDRVEWLSTSALPNLPPVVSIGDNQTLQMSDTIGDGDVDRSDYQIWRRNFGATSANPNWYEPADINENGIVDAADSVAWRDALGFVGVGHPADIDPPGARTAFNPSVSDDGKPTPPGALTTTWSVINGDPVAVVIGDPTDPFTQISFLVPGTYGLQLSAFDGQYTSVDAVSVEVLGAGTGAGTGAGNASTDETEGLSKARGMFFRPSRGEKGEVVLPQGSQTGVSSAAILEDVQVRVFDRFGQEVRSFTTSSKVVTWDGLDNSGTRVSSGVYRLICRLGNGEVVTIKAVVSN